MRGQDSARRDILLGKNYQSKQIVYTRNLAVHEAWQNCKEKPTHLCHFLQMDIISKQKADWEGLQDDTKQKV